MVKSLVWSLLVAILTAGLLFVVDVYAEQPKKKPDVLESLRFKAGQEDINDKRAVKTEMLILKSEELAIKQVKMLIKKYKGMAIEADLQLRLAELYMRRAKTERFFEINRESEFVVKLAPQKVKGASSKRMVRKAINIYDSIERRFRNFDKIDIVIFNNAFARQQIGQVKTSEKMYWRVIKDYGYSPLVPDCHLAIGEMAFNQKRFSHALKHFTAIKKYPNSRVYPYGLYKTAWTQYNLQKTLIAMKELEGVVEYGKTVEERGLDSRLDLRKEALSDMALFYGEVYPSKGAYDYFSKQAKKDEVGELLLKLARIYTRHSKYGDKDVVLRSFIDEKPKDAIVPEIYDQLVWNYEDMKARQKVIGQLKEYQKLCRDNSRWAEAQPDAKDGQAHPALECREQMWKSSIKLARKWLRIWNKNKDYPEFADVSEQAFEIYLESHPMSKSVNEARFAYAQLLFQRNKFRKASENYEMVGRVTKLKKLGHDTRYAAILSLEKAVGEKTKWSDIDEKRLKSLIKLYTSNHTKGKYRLDVEFKLGLVVYEKDNLEEASVIFKTLGERYPRKEKGLKSQDLYLDILNAKKDYIALKDYSKGLLSAKNTKKERVVKLKSIYEQAYFLEVQSAEEKGEIEAAISGYKKFASENSNSKLAENAWWNAVQLHFKIYDFKGGAEAAHKFQEMYPNSENVVGALLKSAQAYEAMGQLGQAATVLEKLAIVENAKKWKWLTLSADFYALDGQLSKAKALYEEIRGSVEPNLSFHALSQLEKLTDERNLATKEVLLGQIASTNRQPQASLAQLHFVEKKFNNNDLSSAFLEAKKVLSMGKDASSYAKSKARYIQAQILEKEFERQSVKSQLDRFTTVFAIKTEKLEKAQTAYQAAIRYGDPQIAVMALESLSNLYSKYVTVLKTMPAPTGLPESEVAAFRSEMEKLAFPMEEKGVDTMLEALNQAKRLKLRDGSVARIQKHVDRLNMKKTEEAIVELSAPAMVVPQFEEVGT